MLIVKWLRMENKVFQYNGFDVTFLLGNENMMVNATEMAKPFGKAAKDFFRTEYAKEFCISLYESKYLVINKWANIPLRNTSDFSKAFPALILCKQGRPNLGGGIWFHEDLAMEFARWLSPMFAIWCNDRLKELLKYGFTATDDMLDHLIANPELSEKIFSKLKEERQKHTEALEAEKENTRLWKEFAYTADSYMKNVFDSANLYQIKAKRYFNLLMEYLKLLKENNVKIPSHLKLYRINYAKDLLRLRN